MHSHLYHSSFVLLQHLDGLGCLWINDENTGVTPLSYQALPTPTVNDNLNVDNEIKHYPNYRIQLNAIEETRD